MLSFKQSNTPPGIVLASVTLLVVVLLALAACGSTSGSNTSGYGSTGSGAATSTPTSSSSGGRYGYPTTPATASPTTSTGSSGALIHTASATIKGVAETLLTNAQGMTLYYRTTDTASSVCSGGCASAWPPLLANGSNTPDSSTSLPGKLSIVTDANGSQVAYNGHPLYTYSGDSAPGQTNGENVAGIWFVVPTTLS